jgi:hypothetical protein
MDAPTKELLDELSDALERMPNNAPGVAGWLVTHYHFRKKEEGVPEPTDFHTQRPKGPPTVDPNTGQTSFMQRTDHLPGIQQTNAKLAALVEAAQSGAADNMYGNGNPDIEIPHDAPSVDDDAAEYPEEIGPAGPKLRDLLVSGEGYVDPQAAPLDQTELQALAAEVTSQQAQEDTERTQVLQKDRMRRVKSQQGFKDGAGGFRRQ